MYQERLRHGAQKKAATRKEVEASLCFWLAVCVASYVGGVAAEFIPEDVGVWENTRGIDRYQIQ